VAIQIDLSRSQRTGFWIGTYGTGTLIDLEFMVEALQWAYAWDVVDTTPPSVSLYTVEPGTTFHIQITGNPSDPETAVAELGIRPTPEPGTMGLAGIALLGLNAWNRRRSRLHL
jgi:hypothetical protein